MHTKWTWWRTSLILISLAPVLRRVAFQDTSIIASYEDVTYTVGIVSWLISYTMLALTFVLAWRFRFIEKAFGGLDKMYIVHAIVGSGSFVFMLLHPIFLVLKYIPEDIYLAAAYLLPGSHWSINFGIAGFLVIILLMILTLYIKKMKYNHRKNSHTFFSLAFLFVAVHVFMIKSTLATIYFPGYYTYAWIVALAWLWCYVYTVRWRRINKKKVFIYQISDIIAHHGKATEILLNTYGNPMDYQAGQFVFLKFENAYISSEAHPFSLASSAKWSTTIKIIMKHSWDFTNSLSKLCVGDRVLIEWPYGKFTLNTSSTLKKVWIAWGIWITPFIGMADELIHTDNTNVDLYYLVRHEEDLVSLSYVQEIAKQVRWFNVIPRVSSSQWRLTLEKLQTISWNPLNCERYVCWPTEMKEIFLDQLRQRWVPENHLYSEWYSFKI